MTLINIFEEVTNQDIIFISNFRKQVLNALENFNTKLDKFQSNVRDIPGNKYLKTIDYKDLNNWSVQVGGSETLRALSSKINHMVMDKNADPGSVLPMLEKMCTGRIKRLKYPGVARTQNDNGHFKWNYKVYTLTDKELEFLKSTIYGAIN